MEQSTRIQLSVATEEFLKDFSLGMIGFGIGIGVEKQGLLKLIPGWIYYIIIIVGLVTIFIIKFMKAKSEFKKK